ncbi:MAG TPA: hydrogenase maturation protease [Chloroflexota bacterium]
MDGVLIEEVTGDMVEMIDMWQGWDTVVLVDAVHSGTPHGSVLRFDALAEPLPRIFSSHVSSHGVGVAEVIELARALDRLPKELIVYGIEGRVFSAGAGLSSEVEAVVDQTAERILQEFRALI